jgi:hypothetical protein
MGWEKDINLQLTVCVQLDQLSAILLFATWHLPTN